MLRNYKQGIITKYKGLFIYDMFVQEGSQVSSEVSQVIQFHNLREPMFNISKNLYIDTNCIVKTL